MGRPAAVDRDNPAILPAHVGIHDGAPQHIDDVGAQGTGVAVAHDDAGNEAGRRRRPRDTQMSLRAIWPSGDALSSHWRTRLASPTRVSLPTESINTKITGMPAICACITRQRPASFRNPVLVSPMRHSSLFTSGFVLRNTCAWRPTLTS